MKKILFLYIGYPKTGTTSLQNSIFCNINNINYLGKESNSLTFGERISNEIILNSFDYIFRNKERIYNEIYNQLTKNKNLISEENFIYSSIDYLKYKNTSIDNIIKKLKEIFDDTEIDLRFIITLRKQYEMITSLYAESYYGIFRYLEETNTFKKFFDYSLDNDNFLVEFLDYNLLIDKFYDSFGKKNVFLLDYDELKSSKVTFFKKLYDIFDEKFDSGILETLVNDNVRSHKGMKRVDQFNLFLLISYIKSKYFRKIRVPNKLKRIIYIVVSKVKFPSINKSISENIKLNDNEIEKIKSRYLKSNEKLWREKGIDLL